MRNISVVNDSCITSGGGICCGILSAAVMDNVSILANYSASEGGGIYLNTSDVSLKNAIISGNKSVLRGGGICSKSSSPEMLQVKITNNFSDKGGGFYCQNGEMNLINLLMANNAALTHGGGIYSGSMELKFVNSSITDNQAAEAGAVFCFNTSLDFLNTIIWNNSGGEIVYHPTYSASDSKFSWSDLEGGESSIQTNGNGTYSLLDGIIDSDPLFTGSSNDPYSLTGNSPCRNTGIPDTTGLMFPLTDLAGGPRIWEDRVDMGAYEWNNVGIESIAGSRQPSVGSYPNPFSSSTIIEYELEVAGFVSLKIFNSIGQEVKGLIYEEQSAGKHLVQWDAADLPAGIYYCSLTTGDSRRTTGKLVKY